MISSIVFINSKGEILIYRIYKDDITYQLLYFLLIKLILLFFQILSNKIFHFCF